MANTESGARLLMCKRVLNEYTVNEVEWSGMNRVLEDRKSLNPLPRGVLASSLSRGCWLETEGAPPTKSRDPGINLELPTVLDLPSRLSRL
jgi:hypothetical protein